MKHLFSFLLFLFIILPFQAANAQTVVGDWYIKDFKTRSELHSDSTATITEKITADCPDCSGKHGIFRTLPTKIRTPDGFQKTPIELQSITDFNGKKYNYTQSKNLDTLTWKIGDAAINVTGINEYQIVYNVRNVMTNTEASSFNWNLTGNFWELDIDNATAEIVFPQDVKGIIDPIIFAGPIGSIQKAPFT